MDGDDIESLGLGGGSSSRGGRERSSEDNVLELHIGDFKDEEELGWRRSKSWGFL